MPFETTSLFLDSLRLLKSQGPHADTISVVSVLLITGWQPNAPNALRVWVTSLKGTTMAHMIFNNDSVAVAKQQAWHGLAKVLPDTFTPQQARDLVAPWDALETCDLTINLADGSKQSCDEFKVIIRSDDRSVLGMHSSGYTMLPVQSFFDLAYEFQSGSDEVEVETAGTLRGGRLLFLALAGNTVDIGSRGDSLCPYLMLSTSFDGTTPTRVDPTAIRPVCYNTVSAAWASSRAGMSLKHTSKADDRMDSIRKAILNWRMGIDALTVKARGMEAAPVRSRADVQEYFLRALESIYGKLPSPSTTNKRERSTLDWATDSLSNMVSVWDREQAEFGANWWVAGNTVTNYLQHNLLSAPRLAINGQARTHADLYGVIADRKAVALDLAAEYATA